MSITTEPEPEHQPGQRTEICRLPGCERVGRPWELQKGYCTSDHWHRHVGRKALADLKYSHTRCFTCFSTLKDIEPPKPKFEFRASGVGLTYNADEDFIEHVRYAQEHTRRAACGYQSLTPEATIGERDIRKKTVTATVCNECGATDHWDHIDILASGHRTAAYIVAFLDDEDDVADAETLHRKYRATGDIELAAGAAIVAAES